MRISTHEELNSMSFDDNEEQDMRGKIKELRYIRVLFMQALMYIFAFLLTWFFVLVSALMHEPYTATDVVKTVLFPMQGFWNLIIFVFDKVFLVRHTDGNENLWNAIKSVFLCPEDTPSIVLTNIDEIVGVTEESCDDMFRFGVLGPRSNGEEKSESKPIDVSSVGGIRSYEAF
jgi:hypothetical protein